MSVCFHCNGTHKCDCLLCGKDTAQPGAAMLVVRVAGACVACKGAAETEKYRQPLTRFDPRDLRLWALAHDGAHYHRVFIPLEYTKHLEETGKLKYLPEEKRWVKPAA